MTKQAIPTYNDGYLYVCERQPGQDFAVRNPRKKEDLQQILKLAYEEKSRRAQDVEYAESKDRSLSIKLKTRLRPEVKNTHMVLIGNILYSIINLDYDRANNEMYFYLEEAKVFAE